MMTESERRLRAGHWGEPEPKPEPPTPEPEIDPVFQLAFWMYATGVLAGRAGVEPMTFLPSFADN